MPITRLHFTSRLLTVPGLALSMPQALAHASGKAAEPGWSFEFWIVLPVGFTVAAYAAGIRRLGRNGLLIRIAGPGRCAAFALGVAVLAAALMSRLDRLADVLFSAHMTQHLLLMLGAPPLLVLGRTEVVLLWALPLAWRRFVGHGWRKARGLRLAIRLLGRPVSVGVLGSAAMGFWHFPGPYAWALRQPSVHIFEHACFFMTSLAFWSLALRPFGYAKGGHGVAIALLIVFALESTLLGAVLVFAGRPFYAVQLPLSRPEPAFLSGLSPLQDQQLAGLIMWVPAGLVPLAALVAVFADLLSIRRRSG
ncbi:cytochrome c oxidase assembly protein [Methylomicrobium sp. RS1]|uniref:cytochrome c oxidase assembly protein n=1 Tax=Candidatus Methylomicrobium oryzae TaxID=2802053 RepID=UPI00192172E8|nr:cytochrome c oxidase assembly protein [Methylomicrobium sp. RS1]